jgi:hypothetical protein
MWNRKKTTLFSRHYLRNRSTSDIGVLGYIGVLYLKEQSPEVWHIPHQDTLYINKAIQTLKTEEVCNNGCISFYSNQSVTSKVLKQISSKGTVMIININFISLFTLKYLGRRNRHRENILGFI